MENPGTQWRFKPWKSHRKSMGKAIGKPWESLYKWTLSLLVTSSYSILDDFPAMFDYRFPMDL
jgi:hypothetical protein